MDQNSDIVSAGHSTDAVNHKNGHYVPIGGPEDPELEKFDKPLPFCGCGIGWFSLLLGFVFPVMWYYAAFLYFWKYYDKDPRERSGLGASAVAAFVCTVAVLVAVTVIVTKSLLP